MLVFFFSLYPYMIESFVVLNEECHLNIFKMIRKKLKEFLKSNYLGQLFFLILFLCVIVLDFKWKR